MKKKKEFLKTLVLAGLGFVLFWVVDQVRYAPLLKKFKQVWR